MLSLFNTIVAATSVAIGVPPSPAQGTAAPVRIIMNSTDFAPGDRVRVQVETGEDGYLVVFRVDGDGRIRVLFPLDPDLDAFVRGGKRYELRGRAQRETFLADDRDGTGLIYAALSREPLSFAAYATGDHWDYDALRLRDSSYDAEADLAAIVRRMSDNGRFDFDVVGYRVNDGRVVAAVGRAYGDPFYDPYWDCLSCGWGRTAIDVRFGVGSRWNRYGGWYDPRWGGDPFYYDPFYWDSYYWGSPWWSYPGQRRPITVINLPRPPIQQYRPYSARPRQGTAIPSTVPGAYRPEPPRVVRPEPRNGTAPADRGGYGSRGRRNDEQDRARPSNNGTPDRPSERRNEPPPSTRPAAPPPSNQGGENRGNARRRPNEALNEVVRSFMPERRPEQSAPIYREPRREAPVERSRPEPREQPVYREPRVERPVERTVERPSSPPPSAPRVERPSSPPPSAPAAPRNEGGGARRRPG